MFYMHFPLIVSVVMLSICNTEINQCYCRHNVSQRIIGPVKVHLTLALA